jgi:hypothetical protein
MKRLQRSKKISKEKGRAIIPAFELYKIVQMCQIAYNPKFASCSKKNQQTFPKPFMLLFASVTITNNAS